MVQGQQRLYENERGQIVIMDGVRHDEFYFPQKDLLLAAKETVTLSAADRFAQLQSSRSATETLLAEDDPPLLATSDIPPERVAHEPLPEVALSHPENSPPYTQIPSPDGTAVEVCGSLLKTFPTPPARTLD